MRLNVNPCVDIVFKAVLGSEHHANLLVHFINAVLELKDDQRVKQVTILNPFVKDEILEGKVCVVDVKAVDQAGNHFQIDIQLNNHKADWPNGGEIGGVERRQTKTRKGPATESSDDREAVIVNVDASIRYRSEIKGIVDVLQTGSDSEARIVNVDVSMVQPLVFKRVVDSLAGIVKLVMKVPTVNVRNFRRSAISKKKRSGFSSASVLLGLQAHFRLEQSANSSSWPTG